MRHALAVAVAVFASTSWAAPPQLAVRHGRSIRVAVAGHSEDGFALRAATGGWRLDVGGAVAGGMLVLRDVTAGFAGPRTWQVPVAAGGALLDEARFRPDHAYRVELRRGVLVVGSALIYLAPNRGRGPVVFDDGDTKASAGSDDDELVTTDKGTL